MPKIPGHAEYLLQLSMDGPDTNWIVLAMLHYDHCEKDYQKVIDIGSCSLLALSGAFRSGVKIADCFLNKILKALMKIFDDSLTRQETYIKMCDVNEFF